SSRPFEQSRRGDAVVGSPNPQNGALVRGGLSGRASRSRCAYVGIGGLARGTSAVASSFYPDPRQNPPGSALPGDLAGRPFCLVRRPRQQGAAVGPPDRPGDAFV